VILECAVNLSEGRNPAVVAQIAATAGELLLDIHSDPHHHRSVLTLAGPPSPLEEAVRAVASAAVATLDLRHHQGVHPRLGVVDVVPFVALDDNAAELADAPVGLAVPARDRFSEWFAASCNVPCFRYGPAGDLRADGASPERTLPEIRRGAFSELAPDDGPGRPHSTAGATAVGARSSLVAYNVFVAAGDLQLARAVANAVRGPGVRALGLDVGGTPQVSCNLIDPFRIGPAAAYDAIARQLEAAGGAVDRAELVGLVPAAVLRAVPAHRFAELDLGEDSTIEARLASRAAPLRP
jgi:glutamate formiminotransferase